MRIGLGLVDLAGGHEQISQRGRGLEKVVAVLARAIEVEELLVAIFYCIMNRCIAFSISTFNICTTIKQE